jgi:excisionase family DNA binding protein
LIEAFVAALSERVARRVVELLRETQPPSAGLVNAKALASHLNLPVSCIYEYAKAGRIPCVRAGKHVRFDVAAVRAALT